jgi:hypothetical protein
MRNKKLFNEIAPNFDEVQAMGYKFQYIEQMNNFRKLVAEHLMREQREQLIDSHTEHQDEIKRRLEHLRFET